ncbi:MAG TPA: glycosyltransferase family 9 protein [Ktedonobacterales bacterium]|nr:glycosyltransferase family 9 protein [Ktedonobacterales bacterium]
MSEQPRPAQHPTLHLRQSPKRILVTALCPIGDTFFLTPALIQVRRRFPAARITALAFPSNAAVLDDASMVDELRLTSEIAPGPAPWRYLQMIWWLAHEECDLLVNFSYAGAILTLAAGMRVPRLGMYYPPLFAFFGNHEAAYRARHAVDHYFKAIEPLIPTPTNPDERAPTFRLTQADRAAARRLLRTREIAPGAPLITLHVGGDGFNGRKRWAPERFAEVASHLIEQYDAQILLVGGKVDIPMVEATLAAMPEPQRAHAHPLAGQTSLKETGALIEASALFIGNDSSPLHIAAAVGTPAIGIFGPSDWNHFAPVGHAGYQSKALHSDLPCSPCFHFVANDPLWKQNFCYSYACLKAISSQQVFETATGLLRERVGEPATAR